jgi:hypothetical protein
MKELLGKSILCFSATSIVIATTVQPSIGFTLNRGANGGAIYKYDESESFSDPFDRFSIATTLKPLSKDTTGGIKNFINGRDFIRVLRDEYPVALGWSFTASKTNLPGTLDIQQYYACAFATQCGIEVAADLAGKPLVGGYGSYLGVTLTPGSAAPPQSRLHWIQRVVSSSPPGSRAGNLDQIDLPNANRSVPYYDRAGTAKGGGYFRDRPYQQDVTTPGTTNWLAETYVVEETAPKQITIYDGFQWGWTTSVVAPLPPTPPPPTPTPIPCPPGTYRDPGSGQCYYFNALARSLTTTDKRGYEITESTATVPEPDSALSLLAAGALGFGLKFRSRKVKPAQKRRASASTFEPKVPPFLLAKYQQSNLQRSKQLNISQHSTSVEIDQSVQIQNSFSQDQ